MVGGARAPMLLGDIGGTNARFALGAADGSLTDVAILRCADHDGIAAAIRAYLDGLAVPPNRRPRRALLAVAGPVFPGRPVHLSNIGWTVTPDALAEAVGVERVTVLNDLHAIALSVPHLGPGDVVPVDGGDLSGDPTAPCLVVAPGTGLGAAILIPAPVPGGWVAVPGEGGHISLAAESEREWRLVARLRREIGHVSAERLLSGPGLVTLTEALAAETGRPLPVGLDGAAIVARADGGADPLCEEAVDLFVGWLGGLIGDLALVVNAGGGVYLAGGVALALRERLAAGAFRRRFEDKGRMSGFLARVPIRLITHPVPALLGLARRPAES